MPVNRINTFPSIQQMTDKFTKEVDDAIEAILTKLQSLGITIRQ